MFDTVESLLLDLLEWVANGDRSNDDGASNDLKQELQHLENPVPLWKGHKNPRTTAAGD